MWSSKNLGGGGGVREGKGNTWKVRDTLTLIALYYIDIVELISGLVLPHSSHDQRHAL